MPKYVVGYWSINGVPACRSPEARNCGVDLACACTPEKYQEMSRTLLEHYPEAKVEHHVGESCPIYIKENDKYLEMGDSLEEYTRQKFAVDNDQ